MTRILIPGSTDLRALEAIWRGSEAVRLSPEARGPVDAAAARVSAAALSDRPIYGINTGFGKLASMKIGAEDTSALQRNLVLSHCCGVGEPISSAHVRLMMALKLLSLGRGASGVRWELCSLNVAELSHLDEVIDDYQHWLSSAVNAAEGRLLVVEAGAQQLAQIDLTNGNKEILAYELPVNAMGKVQKFALRERVVG